MRLSSDETNVYLQFADLALPRHTSYPTVPNWSAAWTADDYSNSLKGLATNPADGISLYVHLPFCRQLCHYCACNREIVPDALRAAHDPVDELLSGLALEARRVRDAVGRPLVHSLHLGGGTPTFLTPAQLAKLSEIIVTNFTLAPDAELASEIDPRVTTDQHLETLRGLGFNRLSLGIQDFAPTVQALVGRHQSYDTVVRVVEKARTLGFPSINFDLIYGLPGQTESSLADTLAKVTALRPERIAFFRLAIMPDLFRWQRTLKPSDLPRGQATLRLMELAQEHFGNSGYVFLGLDHFVLPHDDLAVAAQSGSLARSFQGMSTNRDLATIALGPSGISQGPNFYSQNHKTSKSWLQAMSSGLSADRGMILSTDDCWRRGVIQDLYTKSGVDYAAFKNATGRSFLDYFHSAEPALRGMQELGLLTLGSSSLQLTPTLGRLLVRVVAAAFDAYVPADAWRKGLGQGKASATG